METFGKNIGIISPHIDDAVLSMGGFILNENITFEVINVFTITNYTINGILDTNFVTKKRKLEEQKVSRQMGYNYIFLDYIDAILRIGNDENNFINGGYNTLEDPVFSELIIKLEFLLNNKNYDTIFFPLGLGNHIDHLILADIGKILKEKGYNIVFYEDVAYEEALTELYQKKKKKYVYQFGNINKKISIINMYESQIDLEIVDLVLQTYKSKKGEVLWVPD